MSREFDYGAPWCINAAGHPDRENGYPDPRIHVPPFECRTAGLYLDDVRDSLVGKRRGVEIYAAKPYRFGEPRRADAGTDTRVVLECVDEAGEISARLSIALSDSLRAALHVLWLVTSIDRAPVRWTSERI